MCSSLSTITKSCNPIIPGIVKAWMCDYSSLISFTTYETVITSISFTNTFFELPALKSTTIFDLSIERDFQRGLIKKTSNFSFSLGELSVDNREFIKSLLFKRVVVIIYVNNNYYIFGLNGTLKLDSWNASSGKSQNDFNGYNLNFIDNIHTYGNKKYPYYHLDISTATDLTNTPLAGSKLLRITCGILGDVNGAYSYIHIYINNVPNVILYLDETQSSKLENITLNKGETLKIVTIDYNTSGIVELSYEWKDENDNTIDSKITQENILVFEQEYKNFRDNDVIYINTRQIS